MLRPQVVTEPWNHAHRIHGAGKYAKIGGRLMGSMLPYIAAPWILWDGNWVQFSLRRFLKSWGIPPVRIQVQNAPKLAPKNREDGEMPKCQPGFYPVNIQETMENHHILWVNQLFRLGHFIIFNSKLLNYKEATWLLTFLKPIGPRYWMHLLD